MEKTDEERREMLRDVANYCLDKFEGFTVNNFEISCRLDKVEVIFSTDELDETGKDRKWLMEGLSLSRLLAERGPPGRKA